jgi:hypothetical protein
MGHASLAIVRPLANGRDLAVFLGFWAEAHRARLLGGSAEQKANTLSGDLFRIAAPKSAPIPGSIRQKVAVAPKVRISPSPSGSPWCSLFSCKRGAWLAWPPAGYAIGGLSLFLLAAAIRWSAGKPR